MFEEWKCYNNNATIIRFYHTLECLIGGGVGINGREGELENSSKLNKLGVGINERGLENS